MEFLKKVEKDQCRKCVRQIETVRKKVNVMKRHNTNVYSGFLQNAEMMMTVTREKSVRAMHVPASTHISKAVMAIVSVS